MLLCINVLVASSFWVTRRQLTALLTPDRVIADEMMRILPAAIIGVIGEALYAWLTRSQACLCPRPCQAVR